MENKDHKILITGGHLTPALITADELKKNGYDNLLWIGRKHTQTGDTSESPEYQEVNKRKISFINFNTGKLWRKWNKFTYSYAIKDLFLIPWGFLNAFIIIFKSKPDLVISFGGYVALPIVIAAKLFRVKIITHEQVLNPGLASRIISKLANKILISWSKSKDFFPKERTVLTGNPSYIVYYKNDTDSVDFKDELPLITVFCGNQGAHIINTAMFAILEDLLKSNNIIHQTGRSEVTGDKYKASEIRAELDSQLKNRYQFYTYIADNTYEILNKSDLVIARGGANTMTDLIYLRKKSIIIPIPWSSGQEQLKNAQYLEELGLSTIIQYKNDINPEELKQEIEKRLNEIVKSNNDELRKLQKLIESAPQKILKEIIKTLTNES